jgi:3-methyl-2-oxobutanoate hydroxymethyltransferase
MTVTLTTLRKMKAAGEKLVSLTAYDASFAQILDEAGLDLLLVGDSLGMVLQGQPSTVPVTVDDMVYHTRAVVRGCRRALVMTDMPFLSYTNPAQALSNAARLMQEGGAQVVKLEVTRAMVGVVEALAAHSVPVCAHLGLLPQSVHKLGGYRVQGRDAEAAAAMIEDARVMAAAGADLLLLECVPRGLAKAIAEAVEPPVIGIGAGPDVDGQVLVLHDMLGITPGKRPKFSHDFLAGHGSVAAAVRAYVEAVRNGHFPGPEHSFE